MRKSIITFTFLIILISSFLSWGGEFDPAVDGWYFENFGTEELTWDLFRRAYLGIYPTQDCEEAPLDCLFFDIFKICAAPGNCGGMSLLALSLYKYGGYLGFCSPANFYTGEEGPDRDDLRQALNIMQARQFSASGLNHFLEISDAGNLNDAENAYEDIKEALASGDYPVLTIANNYLAEAAHTVIPYKVEEDPITGNKLIYIWDSNFPYDDAPDDYSPTSTNNKMVISGPTSWTYRDYSGSGGGWCFAIPMSVYVEKSRHPLAVDIIIDSLMTIFITGTGSTISQITDDEGHRLFKTDAETHTFRSDLEDNPSKKLKGIIRWPWYAQVVKMKAKYKIPGELYFMRPRLGKLSALNISLSGTNYKAIISLAGSVIQLNSSSSSRTRDTLRVSGMATGTQSLEIKTPGKKRKFEIKLLRTGTKGKDWRSFIVKNLNISRDIPVTVTAVGDLEGVLVSSLDKKVSFELDIQQRLKHKTARRSAGKLSTSPGKVLRVAPKDWRNLKKTELEKQDHLQTRIKR